MELDTALLRRARPGEIADYFRSISLPSMDENVTLAMLSAIKRGSITPSSFAIWLSVSRSPSSLRHALQQQVSLNVRRQGIKILRRRLRSLSWKQTWDGLGGVSGLLEILGDFSVLELQRVCKEIGRSAKSHETDEKREGFTKLLKALIPHLFQNSPFSSQDQRPLAKHYEQILPGCTSLFVAKVLTNENKGDWKSVERTTLLQNHSEALKSMTQVQPFEDFKDRYQWLGDLLQRYPETPGQYPAFSASMNYSLYVLQGLASSRYRHLMGINVIKELMVPLLRRAIRRKVPWEHIEFIVGLCVKCLRPEQKELTGIKMEKGSLFHYIAICWSRRPSMFEDHFVSLLKSAFAAPESVKLNSFAELVPLVARPNRYRLLKLCYKATLDRDIDNEDDLKCVPGVIGYATLSSMGENDGAMFIYRLLIARRDEVIVEDGPFAQLSYCYYGRPTCDADPAAIYLQLGQNVLRTEERRRIALDLFSDYQKNAESSANVELKAWYAQRAQYIAIASGIPAILKAVLSWTLSFARDQVAMSKLLFSPNSEVTGFIASLCCGIPERSTLQDYAVPELQQRVRTGNEIVKMLFDRKCLAAQEPKFQAASKRHHRLLVSKSFDFAPLLEIITLRMKCSTLIKSTYNLTDDDVYELLWSDLLSVLVEVEKEGLKPANEALGLGSPGGILCNACPDKHLRDEEPSTYRFFDLYGQARNEIWCEYRPMIHPAAASLPEPFPKGLPMQDLIYPFVLDVPFLDNHCPYIASRAHKAVFLDPATALQPVPDDEELCQAFGGFIDEHAFALKLLVPSSLIPPERNKRIYDAWKHATGPLSGSRMSSEDVRLYWEHQPKRYYPTDVVEEDYDFGMTSRRIRFRDLEQPYPKELYTIEPWPSYDVREIAISDWPTVPIVDDPSKTEEWNPTESILKDCPEKTLEYWTYVDLSKRMESLTRSDGGGIRFKGRFGYEGPSIPSKEFKDGNAFDSRRNKKARLDPAIREGQILAALLYIDTTVAAKPRILASPFPSIEDVRFPSLYLEEGFLSKNHSIMSAIETLECHIGSIPPTLLAQVVTNYIKALNSAPATAETTLEKAAFRLISLLGKSDRPILAAKVATEMRLEHSKASSWNRQLFTREYFRKLAASDASECLRLFADTILEGIEEQAMGTADEADALASLDLDDDKPNTRQQVDDDEASARIDSDEKSDSRDINVKTVKRLAQLLSDCDFTSEDTAFGILSTLMQKASNVKIKKAVVESLLSMLSKASPELAERVLTTMEAIIPIAGNLNERKPLTDADFESTQDLPKIQFNSAGGTSLLGCISKFIRSHRRKSPLDRFFASAREGSEYTESLEDSHVRSLIRRIYLPILSHLQDQTSKWASIFLRKHGLGRKAQNEMTLHFPPGADYSWTNLIDAQREIVPDSVLEEYVQYLICAINPPAPILELNKRLKAEPPNAERHEIDFWLSLFDRRSSEMIKKFCSTIGHFFCGSCVNVEHMAMSKTRIQELFLNLFTVVLLTDRPTFTNVALLTEAIRPRNFMHWQEWQRPIIEAMVLYVGSLRTKEWQRDPERQPKVLPDLYQQRLWLLDHPSITYNHDDEEQPSKKFAEQIAKEIDRCAGRIHHDKFAKIEQYLAEKHFHNREKIFIALHLGDITKTKLSWLTMQDQLRVQLASGLIRGKSGKIVLKDGYDSWYTSMRGSKELKKLEERVEKMVETWQKSENEEVRRIGHAVLWSMNKIDTYGYEVESDDDSDAPRSRTNGQRKTPRLPCACQQFPDPDERGGVNLFRNHR